MTEHRSIFVWIECRGDRIKPVSLEALNCALQLSKTNGLNVCAVLFCGEQKPDLAPLSDFPPHSLKIFSGPQWENYNSESVSSAFFQWVQDASPRLIILPASNHGKELGALLSGLTHAPLASDCVEVKCLNTTDFEVKRPIYSGKAFVSLALEGKGLHIMTLRPNVFRGERSAKGTLPDADVVVSNPDAKALSLIVREVVKGSGKLDVTEARVVVSGGMGMQGPENFPLLEELAEVLGGTVGASRPVVDNGWRDYSNQVGQTGRSVSPDLYIACGISGAVQHVAGMSGSKCIVAINKDPHAPIFSIAQYGIVGDVLEIIPLLTTEFKKILHG
jgi:electron transfer flavoprotein alpha subunit